MPTRKPKRGRPPRKIALHVAQVRMDKPLWDALEEAATGQGTTASAVLRECAEGYIQRFGRRGKGR
jgi:hypothetical protein